MNPRIAALAEDLQTRRVKSVAPGFDKIMADLKESMAATPGPVDSHTHAIVFLYETPREPDKGETGTDWLHGAACHRSALLANETAVVVADYLRLYGVDARGHSATTSDVDLNRLAVAAGLAYLLDGRDWNLPSPDAKFLVFAFLAGLFQIIATILLVRLFTLRNFAVGGCFMRTQILIIALLGWLIFGEAISLPGWAAMVTAVAGLVLITLARSGRVSDLWNRSTLYGLGAGLFFALAALLIREASLSFGMDDHLLTAAMVLAYMVAVQTLMMLAVVLYRDAAEMAVIRRKWRPCLFVGLTSVVGSAGWFTAVTLERAAYVATLGQVELLLSLGISVYFFRERPGRGELLGMAILVAGIVALLLLP